MRSLVLCATAAMTVLAVFAAPRFEKVPDQALELLKGARSKSVSSGFLFVNGHYVKPSYRVSRKGTAIFVNDAQITGQIVPWASFLATQDGYVAPAKPVAAAPAPKKAEKSVDDLFDDTPAEKPAAEAEAKPAEVAEESGSFSPNAKSDALLKKVDDARIEVRRRLRDGFVCFYGSRYSRVLVEPRVARGLLDVLPEAMRDANSGAALAAVLRQKGFPFMGRALCDDLVENRADYLEVIRRRESIKEDERLGLTR